MWIIGERINSTRKKVAEALAEKRVEYFHQETISQVEAGADFVDVNAGGAGETGAALMRWLVKTVQEKADRPLCIDSSDPSIVQAGLEEHGPSKPMINSTTADEATLQRVMGLYKIRPFYLIALAMDAERIPSSPEERLVKVDKIVAAASTVGIPLEDIFVDPLVQPVSYEAHAALTTLKTLALFKAKYPKIRSVAGVSNVSFGLPGRALLNRTMLAMMIGTGLDAAIVDPLNTAILSEIRAVETLLGQDEMCLNYIQLFREGRIAP